MTIFEGNTLHLCRYHHNDHGYVFMYYVLYVQRLQIC